MDRITQAASVGDGNADGSTGHGGAGRGRHDEAPEAQPSRLVRSGDRREFTQADSAALALAEQCFARAFAREFAIPFDKLVPKQVATAMLEKHSEADPIATADRIYSLAARAMALGRSRGLAEPGQALTVAAEAGVTEMFEALIEVGTFDGDGGSAVQEMLDVWGQRLARLAEAYEG
ncbi:MAG: hypothetical protein H6832_16260 [Planctomycetes bacterium]|nr:hypothetical protein [Planctomycetota bacterium]